MRQGNGSDLLGANDPRSTTIGIIYVAPNDDREKVLSAILTQEELGRKQVVLVLPEENKAFQRAVDFDGLRNMRRKLLTELIIVAPQGSGPTELARQRRFPVYSSLENYALALDADQPNGIAKKGEVFGRKKYARATPASSPDPGESSQAQTLPNTSGAPPEQLPGETDEAAVQQAEANDDTTLRTNAVNPRRTQPLPESVNPPEQASSNAAFTAPENVEPSEATLHTADVPPVSDEPQGPFEFVIEDLQPAPVPEGRLDVERDKKDEQIIYLDPEEELISVRERLEQIQARRIVLVIPAQTQLRSHVGWRLLHARARELGKDVQVISSDRQVRSVAKAAGFKVGDSLETPSPGRTRAGGRPVGPVAGRRIPPVGYQPSRRRGQPVQRPLNTGNQPLSPQESQPPANSISASPVTNPSEPVGDPFAFDEDTLPPSLPEQYGSAPINATGADVPDITDVPSDIGADYKIEDLGDEEFGNSLPKLPSEEPIILPPIQPLPPREDKQAGSTLRQPPPMVVPRRRFRGSDSRDEEAGSTLRQPVRPVVGPRPRPIRPPGRGTEITPPPRARRPQRDPRSLFMVFALILVLLIVVGYIIFGSGLLPGLAPSATVTITPARANLKNTYLISAVTGVPSASQRQVQERLLSYTTSSQTETVKATGSGDIPAIAAQGSLTFYNALSYSQTIAAGTVFIDANGVQVTNDKAVILPAAHPPTEGMVAVPAHAINTGTNGNIPAFDFNSVSCCTSGVTVQNLTPFSGGRDQVNYTFVQQSDIDGVVNALKASLMPVAQTALKTQIRSNERLIGPVQCPPNVISDHSAGDKAASVTVTVTVTCSGEVYDQQGAQSMAATLLHNQAMANLGPGYVLIGNVTTTITQVKVADTNKSSILLFVNAGGVWVYRFSNAQKQELARLIAGKSETDAQTLLLHQAGVAKADVKVSWLNGSILPTNPNAITMVEQSVS